MWRARGTTYAPALSYPSPVRARSGLPARPGPGGCAAAIWAGVGGWQRSLTGKSERQGRGGAFARRHSSSASGSERTPGLRLAVQARHPSGSSPGASAIRVAMPVRSWSRAEVSYARRDDARGRLVRHALCLAIGVGIQTNRRSYEKASKVRHYFLDCCQVRMPIFEKRISVCAHVVASGVIDFLDHCAPSARN